MSYHPSVKTTRNIRGDDEEMLSTAETTAVGILTEIARWSLFRREDGLRFWSNYYLRRINRFCSMDLHEFISRLCAAVSAEPILNMTIVEELTDDENHEVMEQIRKKPDLLVSLAYSIIKEEKR